ncbi:MAG: acyl carrier protein [Myxococcales bacterium FL481]|nr:MAG: acyl carrier protein [Myxococcales bacterium FL481]
MTTSSVQQAVLAAIASVAPEAELSSLPPDADLREELDIDSMDFLNLVIELNRRLGVEIPEADYGQIQTLAAIVAYVRART